MQTQYRKVKQYIKVLAEHRWRDITPVENIGILPTD